MSFRFPKSVVARFGLGVGAAALILAGLPVPSAYASEPILGAGSTWAFPAVSAWQADVAKQNLTVNYNATGSAVGRSDFWLHQVDFTVSDIPFQAQSCQPGQTGNGCTSELALVAASGRTYQYAPIVAGGTSIMYHLTVNGQRFSGLRLDSATIAKIFTGTITNWSDPEIAANNPGVRLPSERIYVVVRSDGSGASYQFSDYLAHVQPAIWTAFGRTNLLNPPNGPTEYYPTNNGQFQSANGSDGVANTIAAPYSEGTIGYDETAYAVENGLPVAAVENAAHQYTTAGAVNVAEALTLAQLQPNHTEKLDYVYTNPDPRTYPISSYSYLIVPTNTGSPFDASKGQTLSQFMLYLLCQGQQEAAPLKYSPLPPNLVAVGFSVERQIPNAVPLPAFKSCNDPTITDNFLAANHIGAPVGGHPVAGATSSGPAGNGVGSGTGTTVPSSANPSTRGAAVNVKATSAATGKAAKKGHASAAVLGIGPANQAAQVAVDKNVPFGPQFGSHPIEALIAAVIVLLILVGPLGVALIVRQQRGKPG